MRPAKRLLGDLYLTLLQQFGIEIDQFAGARHKLERAPSVRGLHGSMRTAGRDRDTCRDVGGD